MCEGKIAERSESVSKRDCGGYIYIPYEGMLQHFLANIVVHLLLVGKLGILRLRVCMCDTQRHTITYSQLIRVAYVLYTVAYVCSITKWSMGGQMLERKRTRMWKETLQSTGI